MGSKVLLFVAPASGAGMAWLAAHVLITLLAKTQFIAYSIRLPQVINGEGEGNPIFSYAVYLGLEGYLLTAATAIYRRRWHLPELSTRVNIVALATSAVATRYLVTFHPIDHYSPEARKLTHVSAYINEALSVLLVTTALFELIYVLTRRDSDRWSRSVYDLSSPPSMTEMVAVTNITIPARVITRAIQAAHAAILAISTTFAVAFLNSAAHSVPQFVRVLFTEPDAWWAIRERTPDFVAGMIIVCGLWTLFTSIFVAIDLLIIAYASAVVRKRWDATILQNKIHIPLLLLGIVPAWLVDDSPMPWRHHHNLYVELDVSADSSLVALGSLFFGTAITEILFTLQCEDAERWDKSVYELSLDEPILPITDEKCDLEREKV